MRTILAIVLASSLALGQKQEICQENSDNAYATISTVITPTLYVGGLPNQPFILWASQTFLCSAATIEAGSVDLAFYEGSPFFLTMGNTGAQTYWTADLPIVFELGYIFMQAAVVDPTAPGGWRLTARVFWSEGWQPG